MSTLREPGLLGDPKLFEAKRRPLSHSHRKDAIFRNLCRTVASLSVVILAVLLLAILAQGIGALNTNFLSSPADPDPSIAGMYPAIMGSIMLLVLIVLIAIPLGVAAAIILEEFRPRARSLRRVHSVIQLNISNLAGVPSVVFGILGLTAFASMFGMFGNEARPGFEVGATYMDQFYNEGDFILELPVADSNLPETVPVAGMAVFDSTGRELKLNLVGDDEAWPKDGELAKRSLRTWDVPGRITARSWWYFRLPFGRGLLAGALTLALVVLPIIIISSQEALRAVPPSLREASMGLGATQWQTVRRVTLPAAVPGILTGAIIAVSRAIGEAAPLLMIAGIVFITRAPGNMMDDFTAMPLQIYNWAGRPQSEFHDLAASGIVVLLGALLLFNAIAVILRIKLQKPLS